MPLPFGMLSGGEALGELRLLSSAVGPNDRWRAEEDRAAVSGNTSSVRACAKVGVEGPMSECWSVELIWISDSRHR